MKKNQPLNRQLSDSAEELLYRIKNDSTPEDEIRESSFNKDLRPLYLIANFKKRLQELQKSGSMGVNEFAIAASFYRDLRINALGWGYFSLLRKVFQEENYYREKMLLASHNAKDKFRGYVFFLWGLTSKYGTSLGRWLSCGLVLTIFYAFILSFVDNSWKSAPAFCDSILVSTETFIQANYDIYSKSYSYRITLLITRLTGMAYFLFGFGLLLPQLSLEVSRSIAHSNKLCKALVKQGLKKNNEEGDDGNEKN